MTTEETKVKVREIKQSFRLIMNGPASQSMREKGVGYKLNWGVPLMELRNMAAEYGKDFNLAIELYKEDIRECKILATMIMPVEAFSADMADVWMSQCPTQEIAELMAFNLLQYLDYAPALAFEWLAKDDRHYQIAAFQTLARLFMNGREPDDRGINELLDQSAVALAGDDMGLKHAAWNSLQRFMDLNDEYEKIVRSALRSQGLDII